MSATPAGQWSDKDDRHTAHPTPQRPPRDDYDRWNSKLADTKQQSVSDQTTEDVDSPIAELRALPAWKRIAYHVLRLAIVFLLSAGILSIPCWILRKDAYNINDSSESAQLRNLLFWIFVWLEATLISGFLGHVFGLLLPYAVYVFAKLFNPAWRRYWRVARPFAWPITILTATVWGVILFNALIEIGGHDFISYKISEDRQANATLYNEQLSDAEKALLIEDSRTISNVTGIINNVLGNCIFWAVAYFIQKMIITYISVHYNYRTGHTRTQKSKAFIDALVNLYEASLTLNPLYCDQFREQDITIRYAVDADGKKKRSLNFFNKIGGASRQAVGAFGTLLGSTYESHWFKAGSTYALIERALNTPVSAEALAQRIWLSIVPVSKDAMTKAHIAEVLGFGRKEDAEAYFTTLDENENGDIRLSEFEPMLVDQGRRRLEVYQSLNNMDHNISTLSWILHIQIAVLMIYIISINYIAFLESLQQTFSFVCLGVSFAMGRVVAEFAYGTIFILFKHPFDVGDRVDFYNRNEALLVGVKVKRMSLLYCVFERHDTGATVQWSNQAIWDKRVENHTRSGNAKEKFTLSLDINTTFKDLEYLRDEVKAFLARPENRRDYYSTVSLRVKGIHELSKLDVAMVIMHKSNWSNDGLKAARSSRIYCLLLDIARRVPLSRPTKPRLEVGDATRPQYSIVMTEQEANDKKTADTQCKTEKRYDFVPPPRPDAEEKPLPDPAVVEAKAAEQKAFAALSAVPATMTGRVAERDPQPPPMSPAGTRVLGGATVGAGEGQSGARAQLLPLPSHEQRSVKHILYQQQPQAQPLIQPQEQDGAKQRYPTRMF